MSPSSLIQTYLEIRPCKGSDSGMYKCVIQNSHGSAETECEVSIRKCYEAPFFTNTFTRMDKVSYLRTSVHCIRQTSFDKKHIKLYKQYKICISSENTPTEFQPKYPATDP